MTPNKPFLLLLSTFTSFCFSLSLLAKKITPENLMEYSDLEFLSPRCEYYNLIVSCFKTLLKPGPIVHVCRPGISVLSGWSRKMKHSGISLAAYRKTPISKNPWKITICSDTKCCQWIHRHLASGRSQGEGILEVNHTWHTLVWAQIRRNFGARDMAPLMKFLPGMAGIYPQHCLSRHATPL